jgi:hypothetical protein
VRKGNILETRIQSILQVEGIMIPVIWIKNDLYLVGSQKATCQLKSGNVLIRQGVSFELFDQVLPGTQMYHQKVLVSHMISNDESLEWVCDQLI